MLSSDNRVVCIAHLTGSCRHQPGVLIVVIVHIRRAIHSHHIVTIIIQMNTIERNHHASSGSQRRHCNSISVCVSASNLQHNHEVGLRITAFIADIRINSGRNLILGRVCTQSPDIIHSQVVVVEISHHHTVDVDIVLGIGFRIKSDINTALVAIRCQIHHVFFPSRSGIGVIVTFHKC